jgi:hypothetical protein
MKYLVGLLSSLVLVAGGIYVGYLLFWEPPSPPEIVEVIHYRTEYVRIAVTCPEYEACYRSPIKIVPQMNGSVMHIEAGDDCKTTSADVKMECKSKTDWKGRGVAFGLGALLMLLIL